MAYSSVKYGVGEGVRTLDRRNHNPELYQLSYAHHIKVFARSAEETYYPALRQHTWRAR
jgi:hypothetical protein